MVGSQQECPAPPAAPGPTWAATQTQGKQTAPQPHEVLFELNATHQSAGSLWLTASAADPNAGIKTLTIEMNAVGCSWNGNGWSPGNGQTLTSGTVISTANGTETGSPPGQQVTESAQASMVFDVSNYLNGACSGTCLAGSNGTYRSTLSSSGMPCCAEFSADQVDFEFWAHACNFDGNCTDSNAVQYVGFSQNALAEAGSQPGGCIESWPAHNPLAGPVTPVPACSGR
jgi:hypothetical protein